MKFHIECYNDQCLLEAFGFKPKVDITHFINEGRGGVLKSLTIGQNIVGIVDFDKGIKHKYFDTCILKETISQEIKVYYEEPNKNYLIVFNKKLETMIVNETIKTSSLETAKKLGFDNTEGNYHNIRSNEEKLNKLRNLLQTLIQRSPELQKLKQYL
jgi:hypothetical protein